MRRLLKILSLLLLLAIVAYWLSAGANRGWTKTSVPVTIVDEITGIEGVVYEDRFVPGIEFLGGGFLGGGLLLAASYLFKRKHPQQSSL